MSTPPPLEVWGGVECSFVRLHGRHEDQLARTGHDHRIDDVDRFAALGLRALRYPILWDKHAALPVDWGWAAERLGRLRELRVRPIVGFVHHGSGPLPAGLLDPGFAAGLAAFARAFAERFPWIDAYTPVNEPLTTARFGGLYGVWHPHGRDRRTFAHAFLHQLEGVRAAMRAIREINPRAQLIQTEDVGKTHSTPHLAYQADLENERRWLTFDVLTGRLQGGAGHQTLRRGGITAAQLASFADDPCPPDVLGMNYYVTSERFIDERLDRYPVTHHGGNDHDAYADVTAVRVRAQGLIGPGALLRELWQRYGLPIAVTEVQLACTRDEQLRWLMEVWGEARLAREAGVEVRAVTAWALLGAYDWDTLLVARRGVYECGAFDVRGPVPRPTALAQAVRSLATTGTYTHPVLAAPGWWRRRVRLLYPAVSAPGLAEAPAPPHRPARQWPCVWLRGAQEPLGRAVREACRLRALRVVALGETDDRPEALARVLEAHRPWAVVDARTSAGVSDALAQVCTARGTGCLEFVREARGRDGVASLKVNLRELFFPWEGDDRVGRMLRALRTGTEMETRNPDQPAPVYAPDLVHAALDLLIDGERGEWTLAPAGAARAVEFDRMVALLAGHEPLAVPDAWDRAAAHPEVGAAGGPARGGALPSWEDALRRCLRDRARAVPFRDAMPAAETV